MTSAPFTSYFFEDLSVGMSESIMKTVMANDVVGFATLSGDHNPIHLSDHFARKTRFGGRIAHGLYTASLISTVLGMYLPGPGAVYLSQTLNFRAPVRIGDVVSVSVQVVELVAEGRRCTLQCECVVDGKVVLDGQALVMVPSRNGSARPAPVIAKAPAKKPVAKRANAKKSVSKKLPKSRRAKP
jgi:3-hydroxybutyryl-CoA dehydratase